MSTDTDLVLVVTIGDLDDIIHGLGCSLDHDNHEPEEEASIRHLISWLEQRRHDASY